MRLRTFGHREHCKGSQGKNSNDIADLDHDIHKAGDELELMGEMLQESGRTLATRSGIQKTRTLCTAGAQTQILPMTTISIPGNNGVDGSFLIFLERPSDEAQCAGAMSVSVESTSGHTITVETLSTSTGTFHDSEYAFRSHWQCTS